MKKTVLALMMTVASTAFAGGNEIVTLGLTDLQLEQLNAANIIDAPICEIIECDDGSGPVSPGGNDGEVVDGDDKTPGGTETEAALISKGGNEVNISTLKFIAETNDAVVVQINSSRNAAAISDVALAQRPELARALVESARSGQWAAVQVQQ